MLIPDAIFTTCSGDPITVWLPKTYSNPEFNEGSHFRTIHINSTDSTIEEIFDNVGPGANKVYWLQIFGSQKQSDAPAMDKENLDGIYKYGYAQIGSFTFVKQNKNKNKLFYFTVNVWASYDLRISQEKNDFCKSCLQEETYGSPTIYR